VLWQTRRPAEAADAFRAALARKPVYPDAHYMLGTVLRQLGNQDEALSEFRRTLEQDPASAEAWISIGQVLQRQRDADGAARAFAEADRLRQMKADDQAATFAISTGMQKLAANDLVGAIAQFREAVRLGPSNAQAHYQLAKALTRAGAVDEARVHLEEAQRLAPDRIPSEAR
jgi:protein O-GlcNAc transferase